MRRICFLILAVTLAGCTKKIPADKPEINREGSTILNARIETLLLDNEPARHWNEGDAIGVFGSDKGYNEKYLLRRADASLSSALFYGPLVVGETVSAYYPYSASFSGSAELFHTELASVQDYDDEAGAVEQFLRYCPRAFAFREGELFPFRYPFGLVEVKVALDETITVGALSFRSTAMPLSGIAVVRSSEVSMSPTSSNTVRLLCGEGVSSRTESGAVRPFYMVLPAGEYQDLSLTVEVVGETPILCVIDALSVPRIDAAHFALASVKLQSGGPDSFEPVSVQFDE